MDSSTKRDEASRFLEAYLDQQSDEDRASSAFGALRTSAIVLVETCGMEHALATLAAIDDVLRKLQRATAH